jgi:riboflavin kinase / FMN adenylyltransferase
MAAGFFDGVHRGHVKVIERTVCRALELGGEAWMLTFDTHPLRVLNPEAAPLLLTANRHKLALLGRTGVDGCLLLPFTRAQAAVEPEAFVAHLRQYVPSLTEIIVGRNWRFGRHGRGTPGLVSRMGRDTGLRVTVVAPVVYKAETISSTRIRAEVLRGNLNEAAAMLGRPVSILGTVTTGRSIGRKLGFPTANLDPHNEVLPPHGVYAVRATIGGRLREGVMNFGLRPTVADGLSIPTLELHVFDFSGDLYGEDIEVFFVDFLREERKFDSLETMRRAIAMDIVSAQEALRRGGPRKAREAP